VKASGVAVAVSVVALAATAIPPQQASASNRAVAPRLGGRPGFWTLRQLGMRHLTTLTAPTTRLVARYRLPAHVVDGHPLWYTMRLHLRLHITRTPGDCIVSAATDGLDAAQLEVFPGPKLTTLETLGWIQGARRWRERRLSIPFDFRNYVGIRGVRPGVNKFTVKLYNIHGHCFRAVDVLPDSGIGATTIKPDELRLLVPSKPVTVTVGRRARMKFAIARRGGRPDVGATVSFNFPRSFEAWNGTRVHFARIGHTRTGSIEFIPERPGRYAVEVSAPTNYNQPSATAEVDVVPAQSWLKSRLVPSLIAAAFLVTAAALTFATRKRRRTPGSESS
jgi:hypothetical protein